MKTEKNFDFIYMQEALKLAKLAQADNEVPIGAIVINDQGVIVGQGYNQIEKQKTQLAHAEIIALNQAIKTTNNWRLNDHILYVTLEPCMMCFGLIQLSRIKKIVYAAQSPLFSVQFFHNKQYANHYCHIEGGILHNEAAQLLQNFFKIKR